jgi:hypothetical protein
MNVTEERVANLCADIATIIEDLTEFAEPSAARFDAICLLQSAQSRVAQALRGEESTE